MQDTHQRREKKNADSLAEKLFMFTYELLGLIVSSSCLVINYVSLLVQTQAFKHSQDNKLSFALHEEEKSCYSSVKTIFLCVSRERRRKSS
jgi:hypothetical protein